MREKIEFNKDNMDLLVLLDISPERAEQLESCEFHGGGRHSQTEHLMSAYHNEEVTLKELLYVFYSTGYKNGSLGTAYKAADMIAGLKGIVGLVAVSKPKSIVKEESTEIH